jgi:hypothetical protein
MTFFRIDGSSACVVKWHSRLFFFDQTVGSAATPFTSAGDVVGFAKTAKECMGAFAEEHGATRILLFYFGTLSGACFIGHQLNAVAGETQIIGPTAGIRAFLPADLRLRLHSADPTRLNGTGRRIGPRMRRTPWKPPISRHF